jgi:DNA-binding NarL/FixJ family response regulator
VTAVTGPSTPRDSSVTATTGVVVLDDLGVIRDGVRHALGATTDFRVVADGPLDDAAAEMVRQSNASLVLADLGVGDRPDAEFVRLLARHAPNARVVVFTANEDRELLWEVLEAGARGFLLKDTPRDEIVAALRLVASGRTYVDERMAPDVLRQQPRPRRSGALSERERQILQMLADGASNKDVSDHLVVSVETVKTHVKHILAKLGAKHRTEAVAMGLRQGLIR